MKCAVCGEEGNDFVCSTVCLNEYERDAEAFEEMFEEDQE